jgi:gametolysin peptidase M11/alpha-galactosidase-like protein
MFCATRSRSQESAALGVLAFMLLAAIPAGALAQAPPPAGLQAQAGDADFEGVLEVHIEDGKAGSRLRHFLHTADGRRLEMKFAGAAPGHQTGTRVKARGTLSNNTLMLTSGASVQTAALASPYTFGPQQALVILINFTDNAAQPYTPASARSVTFTETSNFYLENSYQQTSLTGNVVGWFTIPSGSATCDTNNWATLADQAAANAGVNLADYPRRIYGFPDTAACSWWGLGTVGGGTSDIPSRAWINGTYSLRVVAHEFGHNLGAYHSRSSECATTGCTTWEYGDDHDIMGATVGHMNAFQKERLGWLNYGNSPPLTTVTASNNYFIEPAEARGIGAKALKIQKSVDAYGSRTWYYVESRQRVGFDGSLVPGVVVHTGSESTGNSSYQLDLDPKTTTFDSLVDVGQTFSDPAINLSITVLTSDASGALVNVSFDSSTACVRANPTVTLSSAPAGVAAGTAVAYTASVLNNDSASCPAAAFSLGATVPSGWTSSLNSASLSLAPGASGTATLQVKSASTAAAGSYSVSLAATNGADTTKSATGSATYSVSAAASLAVTVTTAANYTRGQTVKITTNVVAGSAPAAKATVTLTIVKPNGTTLNQTVTANNSGAAVYSLRLQKSDPVGAWRVDAVAVSKGLTGSGTTGFTVQ